MQTIRTPLILALTMTLPATTALAQNQTIWDTHGTLQVSANNRYLQHADGTPFLWLGDTAWGMGSRTTREDVDLYLDNRVAKGFTVIQAVLHWRHSAGSTDGWGAREANPVNPYGHRAFAGSVTDPDTSTPLTVAGGSPASGGEPNDYWDHVDYIVQAARDRGLALVLLPTWGRQSVSPSAEADVTFTEAEAQAYGQFLGQRYGNQSHIVWAMGGDPVTPTPAYGDQRPEYHAMAQGLEAGAAAVGGSGGASNPLMTYHPEAGTSSSLFFNDADWVDFNMFQSGQTGLDRVTAMTRADYNRSPTRPTINGEAHYEGNTWWASTQPTNNPHMVRRGAYQSYFSGAAGFTYGRTADTAANFAQAVWAFGEAPNGDTWRDLLDSPAAGQMTHLKQLLSEHKWDKWAPSQGSITTDVRRVLVNQTVNGGQWVSLGKFEFDGTAIVELLNEGTDGFVIADAIRFVPISGGTTITSDNAHADVTINGDWATSTATSGYNGSNYLHDRNNGKGDKSVVFTENLTGQFEVFARWTHGGNRASNVPIDIHGQIINSPMLAHAAVRSTDGDELLIYFAANSRATISLAALTAAGEATARWFNPIDGSYQSITGTFATTGAFDFTPPEGWEDAVLILETIPEPAALGMMGVGALLLTSRRK